MLEVKGNAAATEQRLFHAFLLPEQSIRSDQCGVIPDLPIRCSFVVRRDECHARLDDARAHARANGRELWSDALEQVGGNAQIQQPDRLKIGAEKRPCRSEYIVDIGV